MKGVIDRFEGNDLAVILIEEINKELVVPISELPEGSKENTWLNLKEDNGSFKVISINDDKTEKELDRSKDLLAQLRAKNKGSRFKKQ